MNIYDNSAIKDRVQMGIGKRIFDHIPIKGHVLIQVFDGNGKLKLQKTSRNTITVKGDALVADQMSDQGEVALSHMAFGTGTGQIASSNTLATETDRVALDSTTKGVGASDNDVIWIATLTGVVRAVTEIGLFNDNAAGDMFAYDDFGVVTLAAVDSLVITWTGSFGAS